MWSFFGSGHDKRPHDSASAVVERFVWWEQLKSHGVKVQNASKVVQFLCEHLSNQPKSSYIGKKKPLQRNFWHIMSNDVDRSSTSYACDTMQGTMKVHNICATNKHILS
jgi:hypothetical protein